MPEIKNTFTGGKMNKDLDERLVQNGEYRHALNIQVRTTDGGSDGATGAAGTVQNMLGTSLIGQVYTQPWQDANVVAESGDFEAGVEQSVPRCIGSIADEKNDKSYFLFGAPIRIGNEDYENIL